MVLRLQLRNRSDVPLEVEGITADVLRDKSLADIEKLDIFQGNVKLPLAEFFSVSGDPADEVHDWEGDLAGVHWIGAKMTAGRVVVHGNAGRHVGSEMAGGEIHVLGDASDWLGGEMHGGLIHVRGKAGHLVGSAYRGSAKGMTKGTILVGGDAGNEIGHSMRRGLVAIGGNIGDLAGLNMLAGSIFVFGTAGIRHGAGMKRGTLAFLGPESPPLLPTFRRACRYRPEALLLVYRELTRHEFAVPDDLLTAACDLYNGDFLEGGRGELLVKAV
ncbi:MAG TPA: formylmethanofuran dehydrogenase subunit C [Pirellulaceae bacterium]|nr:formylmethanofuran dehydrogenase subunit C [Pirellulaceae bacterium]